MRTVQKIKTALFEQQGLIEYDGEPEDLEEWLDAVWDKPPGATLDLITEWEGYTKILRLVDVDGSYIYYLVPAPPTAAQLCAKVVLQ